MGFNVYSFKRRLRAFYRLFNQAPPFKIFRRWRKHVKYGGRAMFNIIDIETTSICNRKCDFCPVKYGDREQGFMDEKLYYSIIDQLSEIDYFGAIHPHLFGEPLIDKRIVDFVKYAREKCPKARIVVKSNGDLLDYDTALKLIEAGVTTLFVTQYDGYFHDHVKDIYRRFPEKHKDKLLFRIMRNPYSNRGGLVGEDSNAPLEKDCDYVNTSLFVDFKGKCHMCPDDFYGKVIMGDVNKENVVDIFNNKKYRDLRAKLKKGERKDLPICDVCNHYIGIGETGDYIFLNDDNIDEQ